jgi:hypothetical protein
MNIIRSLKLIAAIPVLLLGFHGCSSHKLRLPQEEIIRPLSLPPENWRIGLDGCAIFYNYNRTGNPHSVFQPIFAYPYFQLGTNWEYYIPASFKYYLLKNIKIQDSTICVTGPNSAISAGWTGITYSAGSGLRLTFEADLDCKYPVSEKLWLFSNINADYESHVNDFGGSVAAGVGYQFSRPFFMTVAPALSFYKYTFYDYWYDNPYSRTSAYVVFPLLMGVNFSKAWALRWKNSVVFYHGTNLTFESLMGFHFTW